MQKFIHLIKADGTEQEITPKNGKRLTLEELYGYVGSPIDIVRLPEIGGFLVFNDEGRIKDLPRNAKAEAIWRSAWPIEKYPNNNDGIVVGDVIHVSHQSLI